MGTCGLLWGSLLTLVGHLGLALGAFGPPVGALCRLFCAFVGKMHAWTERCRIFDVKWVVFETLGLKKACIPLQRGVEIRFSGESLKCCQKYCLWEVFGHLFRSFGSTWDHFWDHLRMLGVSGSYQMGPGRSRRSPGGSGVGSGGFSWISWISTPGGPQILRPYFCEGRMPAHGGYYKLQTTLLAAGSKAVRL